MSYILLWDFPTAWADRRIAPLIECKKHKLRKKKLRIQKEMDKEITFVSFIDENMNKMMKKTLIFAKIKNYGNRKW